MIKYFIIFLLSIKISFATEHNFNRDTIFITEQEAYRMFVENNLILLAESLKIDIADAVIRQAKLWENPSLEIGEVNFWATEHQLSLGDELPPIFGDEFGKNRQFAVQLEQLILIAGKRNKLIVVEQVKKEITEEYFDLIALNLKNELYDNIAEMVYMENSYNLLQTQKNKIKILVNSARGWYESNDIPKVEYYRLFSLLNEIDMELMELRADIIDLQAQLRILLVVPYNNYIKLIPEDNIEERVNILLSDNIDAILNRAMQNNPQMKIADLNIDYYQNLLKYERALVYPDLALNVGYARDNFLLDFIGFGLSMDIPVFNRNQGNIQIAQIEVKQNEILLQNTRHKIENKTFGAWQKLIFANKLYSSIDKNIIDDFEDLMEKMNEYYADRTVGMLEYLDFFDAYRDVNKNYRSAKKSLTKAYNKMIYLIGE